ncbi:MAG TPA: sensor domain-containing diguanylate cyclase [Solirubrobacteraceae bacterium]
MGSEDRDPGRIALSIAPFAGAAVLAWVTVLIGNTIDWPLYALATGLLLASGALSLTGLPRFRAESVLVSLTFLAAVGLLRSSTGGINSGSGILALIPVFYTALYRGRRELAIVVVATLAFYVAPIVLVGAPSYPHSQYRAALLSVVISSIIGIATQHLVVRVRNEAHTAHVRERVLERVNEVVQSLFDSSQVRHDVCEAARTIGEASAALLYEPTDSGQALHVTAVAGLDATDLEVPIDGGAAVAETFASGHAKLLAEGVEAHVGQRELWEAVGRPSSILYEPLLRGAEQVGVLAVAWPEQIRPTGSRVTVIKLLAHEAALALERADMLSQLTDMAETDPLTGLPNRRAWEACVEEAVSEGRQLTIAMLDLDHFKQFNDQHGHPAGDRLLKETAALWREQLRTGDMLARLGGEEFGLLLLDSSAERARDAIERLRDQMPHEQTCSAGFAVQMPEECPEEVMFRADAALYIAKSSGRNRACMDA